MTSLVKYFLFIQIFFVLGTSAIAGGKVILKSQTQSEITSISYKNNFSQSSSTSTENDDSQKGDAADSDSDGLTDDELLISLFRLSFSIAPSSSYFNSKFQSPPQPEISVSTPPPKK